tara:strand:+ start:962 stop:2185 length:1224 start_codon:yes stop_codon:yes gene_type:complete
MVIVAKTKSEYEIKRQKFLDNLKLKEKNRKNYLKAKKILKETGSTMYEPSDNRTTVERLEDLQLLDENLEKLLLKDIGANSGNSKNFLSKLDENLKQFLLSRFPEFTKIFNKNFLVPNAQNLRLAFDLFNQAQIEKSKTVEVPSQRVVEDYIRGLNDNAKLLMSNLIIDQLIKRGEFLNIDRRDIRPDDVFDIAINFLRFFDNEVDAYTSLYATVRGNFPDFPKLTIAQEREGIPSNTWNVRPSRAQEILETKERDEDEGPSGSTPQTATARTVDKVIGVERWKGLMKFNKKDLETIVKKWEKATKEKASNKLTKNKKSLVRFLLSVGFNDKGTNFSDENILDLDQLDLIEAHLDKYYENWDGKQGSQTDPFKRIDDPSRSINKNIDLSVMEGYGMHYNMKGIIFLR